MLTTKASEDTERQADTRPRKLDACETEVAPDVGRKTGVE
jgi:hypothetical protein